MSCGHIHNVVQPSPLSSSKAFSSPPKRNPIAIKKLLHIAPSSWQLPICFLFLWIYLFWIFQINGIIYYVIFYAWLLSLSIIFLKFIHIVVHSRFIPFYGRIILHCMDIPQCVYLSGYGRFSCFHI